MHAVKTWLFEWWKSKYQGAQLTTVKRLLHASVHVHIGHESGHHIKLVYLGYPLRPSPNTRFFERKHKISKKELRRDGAPSDSVMFHAVICYLVIMLAV